MSTPSPKTSPETTMKTTTVRAINEQMRKLTAYGAAFKPVVIAPPKRSSGEIAEEMILRARTQKLLAVGTAPVQGLPHGKLHLPAIETSVAAAGMIARAAEICGWSLERFILDAAVAHAQRVRDECQKARIPFSKVTDDDPNPDLRVTQGIHGIKSLEAFSDDESSGTR